MVEVHMDDDAIEFVHRQKQKEVTMDDQIVENIVVDSVVVKENNVNIGLLKATTSSWCYWWMSWLGIAGENALVDLEVLLRIYIYKEYDTSLMFL